MKNEQKLLVLSKILEAKDEIPTPPPGRYMALVKTKLEEAELYMRRELGEV
jgi:hypothetical protein